MSKELHRVIIRKIVFLIAIAMETTVKSNASNLGQCDEKNMWTEKREIIKFGKLFITRDIIKEYL
jgi:hypothetical protein